MMAVSRKAHIEVLKLLLESKADTTAINEKVIYFF
jgi:hypothetical protein